MNGSVDASGLIRKWSAISVSVIWSFTPTTSTILTVNANHFFFEEDTCHNNIVLSNVLLYH